MKNTDSTTESLSGSHAGSLASILADNDPERVCPACERRNNTFVNPTRCYHCGHEWEVANA